MVIKGTDESAKAVLSSSLALPDFANCQTKMSIWGYATGGEAVPIYAFIQRCYRRSGLRRMERGW